MTDTEAGEDAERHRWRAAVTDQDEAEAEAEAPKKKKRRVRSFRLTRDGVIFVVGLLGIIHQTLIVEADRPTLLFIFGAMIGLPAFLRLDDKKNNEE